MSARRTREAPKLGKIALVVHPSLETLASFTESGGLFSQQASPGFIELWTLQSRMAHEIRMRANKE